MPKPFLIVKNANQEYNWSHFERDATTGDVLNDYSISDFFAQTINGYFGVQKFNGENHQAYFWADIELRDDFSGVAGTPYFPTSANDLRNWLIARKYPAYPVSTGGGGTGTNSWYSSYENYSGATFTVPSGFDGSIRNMDVPQSEVSFTVVGTTLTIDSGVDTGEFINIYGIYPTP